MSYKRKCPHWLTSFMNWNLPRSEVKEHMILWAGLFSIATAIRRRVWVPKHIDGKTILGGWECYPHIYLMFIAPPGMRKTTTLNYALELFEAIPGLVAAPNACSQAALSQSLINSPDTSLYIVAEEFSDLLLKSGNEMYEFLTSAFDGRKKFESSTISRGVEFIERPCINMGAGTTPIWISHNMPESAIGGGFASRVLFLYTEELRHKRLYYPDYDSTAGEALKEDLIEDLIHISKQIEGPYNIEPDAMEFMEAYYAAIMPETKHPKVQGYYQRKHVHAHKVAMLYKLSYSDELILTKHDFEMALQILGSLEEDLIKVFGGIGKNTYTFEMSDIYNYIRENGPVPRKEILGQFRSAAAPTMLNELIDGLIAMGAIGQEQFDGGVMYKVLIEL